MADTSKETHVEKHSTEIEEVQSFGGGEIKSVEPIAEVHEEMHHYSGGQIVEHSNTILSPWLWIFWGVVIVTIFGVLLAYGAIPGFRIGETHYPYNPERTVKGYQSVRSEMMTKYTPPADMPADAYISMNKLNQAIGGGKDLKTNINSGQDLYQHYCIGCHGPNQDGAGPNAVNLNPAPRNLRNQPFMQALSLQRIETSVHEGVPGTAMPRWKNTLTDTQINEAIIYVLSLTAPQDANGNFLDPLSGAGSPSATNYGGIGRGPSTDKAHAAPPSMSGSHIPPVTPTFKAGSGNPPTGGTTNAPSALSQPEAPSGQVGSPPPAAPAPKL